VDGSIRAGSHRINKNYLLLKYKSPSITTNIKKGNENTILKTNPIIAIIKARNITMPTSGSTIIPNKENTI